jgi:hypothetical protein
MDTDTLDRPSAKMCRRRLEQEIKPAAVRALEHEVNTLNTEASVLIPVVNDIALNMIATTMDVALSTDPDDDEDVRAALRDAHADLIIEINKMFRDFLEHRN